MPPVGGGDAVGAAVVAVGGGDAAVVAAAVVGAADAVGAAVEKMIASGARYVNMFFIPGIFLIPK